MARRREVRYVIRRRRIRKPKRLQRRKSVRSSKLVTKPKSSSVVKVVRSILSFLPGQTVIQPLADMIFKGLGYSDTVTCASHDGGENFQAAVSVVGLVSCTSVKVQDIVAFASNSVRTEKNEVYEGAKFKTKISVVRMLNFEISLRNTTPVGTKTGNWAAWLKLIKHEDQGKDDHIYTYKDLSEMSFATVATAREDIVLRVPRFHPHWKCGRELLLTDTVAVLYVGFEDINRNVYTNFTSSDFCCSGTISSSFVVLAEHPGNYPKEGSYKMKDVFSSFDYLIYGNGNKYKVKSTKVQRHENKMYIRGKVKVEVEEEEDDMVVI